ncbi:MAG: hypothetical protein AB7O24_11210 [Kofleriaceae bacterium]
MQRGRTKSGANTRRRATTKGRAAKRTMRSANGNTDDTRGTAAKKPAGRRRRTTRGKKP